MDRRLLDGPGAVDIYAFDSYPFSRGCENPDEWPNQVNEEYLPFFDDTAGRKGQPYFIVSGTRFRNLLQSWLTFGCPILARIPRRLVCWIQ
jgi:hypothetical protein